MTAGGNHEASIAVRQFLVVITIQAVIALTTLGCATALTILGKLPSDAAVALFGSAIALAGGTAGVATVRHKQEGA